MKNKKFILVFTLIVAFLLVMISITKATDINQLQVQPIGNNIIGTDTNNEGSNTPSLINPENTTNTGTPVNTVTPTNTITPTNTLTTTNITSNNTANDTLPQTGVAEDTALFVFIAICIVSAIYAFVRIRNYKNI